MVTRNKKEASTIDIVDAVETLSKISDLEFDRNIGVSQPHDLTLQDKKITYRTVHWLNQQDADITVALVKDTFKVILNYLRSFYKKEYGYITDEHTIEGIKTIMVLVGEAAKKLDKYTHIFHQTQTKSVTELKEYKKLQDFYLTRIARKIDEGVLGKWILALTKKAMVHKDSVDHEGKKVGHTKHVFIDLESVKKDAEYELFFMRKEDGSRFFSPRLIRNIKLISDFGEYFGKYKGDDPLGSLEIWQDRFLHACGKNILRHEANRIAEFYREGQLYKERELVVWLNKTLMALMLSCNPHNLMHNIPIKDCRNYFFDFQTFLNNALHCGEYKKLLAYPSKSKIDQSLLELVHGLCYAFCCQLTGYQELNSMIHSLLQESHQNSDNLRERAKNISSKLRRDYSAMTKLLKLHPNGCLNKLLEKLEGGDYHAFDPLMQENIPGQLYNIHIQDTHCAVVRIPSPTHQEFIQKVSVNEIFKGFIRGCSKDQRVLLLDLQDRTSWRENSRSKAIADLGKHDGFSKHLSVVSLSKDSEFFNQLSPYNQDNRADVFIENLKKYISDESNGCAFPDNIKIPQEFVDGIIAAIHRIFFSNKNMLLREHRMDFIELFYLFLQLKVIDLVKPDIVVFACKDGIDVGEASAAQFFAFLKLLNQEVLSDSDQEQLDLIIYAPAILLRERLMHSERFNRMVSVLKAVEGVREQHGHSKFAKLINETFGRYYKRPILKSKIVVPK